MSSFLWKPKSILNSALAWNFKKLNMTSFIQKKSLISLVIKTESMNLSAKKKGVFFAAIVISVQGIIALNLVR